jgi:hypothetical protein
VRIFNNSVVISNKDIAVAVGASSGARVASNNKATMKLPGFRG